jgi:hypothetical protein
MQMGHNFEVAQGLFQPITQRIRPDATAQVYLAAEKGSRDSGISSASAKGFVDLVNACLTICEEPIRSRDQAGLYVKINVANDSNWATYITVHPTISFYGCSPVGYLAEDRGYYTNSYNYHQYALLSRAILP